MIIRPYEFPPVMLAPSYALATSLPALHAAWFKSVWPHGGRPAPAAAAPAVAPVAVAVPVPVLVVVGVPNRVHFESGSDAVSPAGKRILDGYAQALKARPDAKVELSGFADPTGDTAKNLELAKHRGLHDSVFNGRDPEWTITTPGLRYHDLLDRAGLIIPVGQPTARGARSPLSSRKWARQPGCWEGSMRATASLTW